MDQIWLWVGFNAFVLAMLALDLGVFHKEAYEVSVPASVRGNRRKGERPRGGLR